MHISTLSSPLFLLAASLPSIVNAAAPTLTWDCSKIPNVCENMCWGVACVGNNGAFASLTYDAPDKSTKDDRRKTAFCGSHNRCTTDKFSEPAYSCDEFPFSTTKQAGLGGQVSRCVPGYENEGPRKPYNLPPSAPFSGCDAQGKILAKWGHELKKHYSSNCQGSGSPCQYSVAFENHDTTNSFCALKSGQTCDNVAKGMGTNLRTGQPIVKQQEQAGGSVLKNTQADANVPTKRMPATTRRYKLESGRVITAFHNMRIGDDTIKLEPTSNCSTIDNQRALLGINIDPENDFMLDSMFHVVHDKVVDIAE